MGLHLPLPPLLRPSLPPLPSLLLLLLAAAAASLGGARAALVPFDFTYTGYSPTGYCASPLPSTDYRTCIFDMLQCTDTDRFQTHWVAPLSMPSSIASASMWSVDSGTMGAVSTGAMTYEVTGFGPGVHDVKFTMPNTPTGGYSMRFVGCTTVHDPVFGSVSPNIARQGGGTPITVTGQYFGSSIETSLAVKFSPVGSPSTLYTGTLVSWTPTQIVFTSPAVAAGGFGAYNLVLAYSGGGAGALSFTAPSTVAVKQVQAATVPLVSSDTALPAYASATNVTINGVWFEKGEPQNYWLNLTSSQGGSGTPPTATFLKPVLNADNSRLVFTFTPAHLGGEGTRALWTLYYTGYQPATPPSQVTQVRVCSSPYAVALPYFNAQRIATQLVGPVASPVGVTLRLMRHQQSMVALDFAGPVAFTFSGASPPLPDLALAAPLPEEYRPAITQRCYSHVVVNGAGAELKADIRPSGDVVFYSTLGGAQWTTSGTLYFNGCSWLAVGSSRVDLQACKLEYSIVSPK